MDYKFQRYRADKISKETILGELEKVAKLNDYMEFSAEDFNKKSDISSGTVKNEFGSWNNALTVLRERLKENNLEFNSGDTYLIELIPIPPKTADGINSRFELCRPFGAP